MNQKTFKGKIMTIKIHNDLLNFVRPSDHSTYSPSSMDRILACPFSVEKSKYIPNVESIYAAEGTLAHSVGESLFYEEHYGIETPTDIKMQMLDWDKKIPGTISEMMSCAHTYVNTIEYWLANDNEIGEVLWFGLEKGVPIFPEDGCFGTADCLIVGTKGAAVIDYKHGKGKNVSADSIQLRSYAAGIARYLENIPEDYRFFSIVVQPRTDIAPKVASYTYDQTMDMLRQINLIIIESKKERLEPIEGSHCHWCPLNQTKDPSLKCPAKLNKAQKLLENDFKGFLTDMNADIKDLTVENRKRDEAIIKIISLLPLMNQIAKDGEEEFMFRIEKGEIIPGVNITQKEGNRQWVFDDKDAMVSTLKIKFPALNPLKEVPATTKLKTLGEVEKEVGKDKLNGITIRKVSKKLSIEDSKIQEVLGEMSAYGNMTANGSNEE